MLNVKRTSKGALYWSIDIVVYLSVRYGILAGYQKIFFKEKKAHVNTFEYSLNGSLFSTVLNHCTNQCVRRKDLLMFLTRRSLQR